MGLVQYLFRLSRNWGTMHRRHEPRRGTQWPVPPIVIIVRYCLCPMLLFDNMTVLPLRPSDFIINQWYYDGPHMNEDREMVGWLDRTVDEQVYIDASEKRHNELIAEDKTKKPICSDEDWGKWWISKRKLKAEMMRALKKRAMGYDDATDKYDYEYWEDVESSSDEGDWSDEGDEGDEGESDQDIGEKEVEGDADQEEVKQEEEKKRKEEEEKEREEKKKKEEEEKKKKEEEEKKKKEEEEKKKKEEEKQKNDEEKQKNDEEKKKQDDEKKKQDDEKKKQDEREKKAKEENEKKKKEEEEKKKKKER